MARYLRTFVPGNEATLPYPRGGEKDVLPPPAKAGK